MQEYYLEQIYLLLSDLVPLANLLTGIIQFAMVVFAIVIIYKLFNLFF